jgi:hypothetical protein
VEMFKDSRRLRQITATFIIGGASVVLVKFAFGPEVEKMLRTKARA